MFIVKPKTRDDFKEVLLLTATHNVSVKSVRTKTSNPEYPHLRVSKDETTHGVDSDNEYRMCEMSFQMNFNQDGTERICEVCRQDIEVTGEGESVCGHLTFTSFKQRGKYDIHRSLPLQRP